jgi:hypothetical protein
VVAAKAAVKIGPNHAALAEANPGAILQAAILQREICAHGALLHPPGIAAAAAAAHAAGLPAPQGAPQVPRPGQASLPTFSDCSADGWFLFRRAYTVRCQINNWDDLRSRRQLLLALKDGALAKIANLQPTPDPFFYTKQDVYFMKPSSPFPHTTQYTIMRLLVPMVHFSPHDAD